MTEILQTVATLLAVQIPILTAFGTLWVWILREIQKVQREVPKVRDDMNAGFTRMEARLDRLETRVERLESRLYPTS